MPRIMTSVTSLILEFRILNVGAGSGSVRSTVDCILEEIGRESFVIFLLPEIGSKRACGNDEERKKEDDLWDVIMYENAAPRPPRKPRVIRMMIVRNGYLCTSKRVHLRSSTLEVVPTFVDGCVVIVSWN